MLERLAVAQAAERARVGRHAVGEQRPHFVDQAAPELFIHAPRDPFVEFRRRHVDQQAHRPHPGPRRDGGGEMRRERRPREEVHLERAHEPHEVARLDPCSRRRVDARDHAVQERRAAAAGDGPEPLAQGRISRRARKQPARQRAKVEPGAADEHRLPAPREDVADRGGGVAAETRGRVVVGRFGDVD